MDKTKLKIAHNIKNWFRQYKWFYSFGTLLNIVREKKYNLDQDIDICVIGDIDQLYKGLSLSRVIIDVVLSNSTKKVLKFSFKDHNTIIDVYRLFEHNGMYWHTYDMYHEGSKILSKYYLKSMPKHVFEFTSDKSYQYFANSPAYEERCITKDARWNRELPEFINEDKLLYLPFNYGTFLDIAYPDWAVRRENYGQSKGYSEKEVKSLKGIV